MKKTAPLVSIIIPCYNHGLYVEETLNSVHKQLYTNIETIIINDGSTDDYTIEILGKIKLSYPEIIILNQSNSGPSVARNNGLKTSKGKYVVFLDGDDKIRKNAITSTIDFLEKDNSLTVIYGDCAYFGERKELRKQQEINSLELLVYNTIAICSIIRKSAFNESILFDEYLSKLGLEDYELWINFIANNYKFHYINETLFDIRVTNTSRTYKTANKNIAEIKNYIYKKHASFISKEYERLFYQNKLLKTSLEFKIGEIMLLPYRFFKKLLKH